MRWLATACLAVAAAWSCPAAAEGMAKVSCRDRGRVVYLANVRESAVATATAAALSEFPGALCVALGPEPPPDAPAPGAPGDIASVLSGATATPSVTNGATSLDAALRALRGEAMHLAVPNPAPTPVPTPPPPAEGWARALNFDAMQTPLPGWARLSVYKDADADVALADWDRIVSADPATFAALTPDIRVVDGAAMLGAGPVSPGERASFCLAAQALSLDCRFGASPPTPEAEEALGMAGAWETPSASPRVDGLDAEAGVACPDATLGHLACWSSREALAESDALPPPMPPTTVTAARPAPPAPAQAPQTAPRAGGRRHGRAAKVAGR